MVFADGKDTKSTSPQSHALVQEFSLLDCDCCKRGSQDSAHLQRKTFRRDCTPPGNHVQPSSMTKPRTAQRQQLVVWKRGANSLPPQGNTLIFPTVLHCTVVVFHYLLWTSQSLGKLQKTSEEDRTSGALWRGLSMSFFPICPSSSNKVEKQTKRQRTKRSQAPVDDTRKLKIKNKALKHPTQ